eukprot:scaffold872_cov421-Prasinococcus_capsulatus_cf.AAC.19
MGNVIPQSGPPTRTHSNAATQLEPCGQDAARAQRRPLMLFKGRSSECGAQANRGLVGTTAEASASAPLPR